MGAAATALTAISALAGHEQNRKAQRTADEGMKMQKETLDRKNAMYDLLKGIVTGADAAGEFDPESRIKSANDLISADEGKMMERSAGASRILGYRPGDSAPVNALRGVSESADLERRRMDTGIRNNAFDRKLSAYGSLNAPTEGIAVGQNMQQNGISRMQDTTGLWASIMPFIMQKKQQMNPGTGSGLDPYRNSSTFDIAGGLYDDPGFQPRGTHRRQARGY